MRADLLVRERPSWSIELTVDRQAVRTREQVVSPACELVLCATVEVQHPRRRVGHCVVQTRCAACALHPHIGGVAVHRLEQTGVAVELEPVVTVDKQVARHVLVVEPGRIRSKHCEQPMRSSRPSHPHARVDVAVWRRRARVGVHAEAPSDAPHVPIGPATALSHEENL